MIALGSGVAPRARRGQDAPMRHRLFPVVALLVVLPLAGCTATAQAATRPATVTAHGTMTISGYGNISWGDAGASDGAACQGTGGFSDMTPGAAVVVTDSKGKTIGTGSLAEGVDPRGGEQDFTCRMPFTVSGLPAGESNYGFHVGNGNRGVLEFAASHLPDVELTLGP